MEMAKKKTVFSCPVCHGEAPWHDVVDFNRSCEEPRGRFLPLSGVPVYYAMCKACSFCFAPELHGWSTQKLAREIYNDRYADVDPDFADARPRANAGQVLSLFRGRGGPKTHLDLGGGAGVLSKLLSEAGWQSTSHDSVINNGARLAELGRFDLVTAFEVLEHVADLRTFMRDLQGVLAPDGLVLISTLLSDGFIQQHRRLDWWYAAPRNGHISLFSANSLTIFANRGGFRLVSFSAGFHALFATVPSWAAHLFPPTGAGAR